MRFTLDRFFIVLNISRENDQCVGGRNNEFDVAVIRPTSGRYSKVWLLIQHILFQMFIIFNSPQFFFIKASRSSIRNCANLFFTAIDFIICAL